MGAAGIVWGIFWGIFFRRTGMPDSFAIREVSGR